MILSLAQNYIFVYPRMLYCFCFFTKICLQLSLFRIHTKMADDITESSASNGGKQVKCTRTLVRFAAPCILGCKTFRLNEPTDAVKTPRIVNLFAIMNSKENHVTYAEDTAQFYKSLTPDDKSKPMHLSSVQSVYVCPYCHNYYLSKRKQRFTDHEKKCSGYGRTTYNFSSEDADIKLIS